MKNTIQIYDHLLTTLFFCIILQTSLLLADDDSQWLHGIVRVNTTVSAGKKNFEEVVKEAENADLDYIIFTDQFLVDAEYGVLPFRNVIKIFKERKSILEYGVKRYLDDIKKVDRKYPDITVIPGADIAPYYFWENNPLSSDFSCHQFSEQMTVFGAESADFYAKLPVIHNEQSEFSWGSLWKVWPLSFVFLGVLILKFRYADTYSDRQGNVYTYGEGRGKAVVGYSMILLGLLWTINNRPFTRPLPFDQYHSYGTIPYQNVIDYVKGYSQKGTCGIFWSAPEAAMEDSIAGVKLITYPYLDDVVNTDGHNGFAGIYGDAYSAQKTGKEWDKMLMEYCAGTRSVRPVVIGELDYHGKMRRIDMIQTVVKAKNNKTDDIVQAICNGCSYAYLNDGRWEFVFEKISLESDQLMIEPGGILSFNSEHPPTLRIKGSFLLKDSNCTEKESSYNVSKVDCKLTVVSAGKKIYEQNISSLDIDLKIPLDLKPNPQGKGYVRIMIEEKTGLKIFMNPFFYSKNDSQ